MAKTMPELYLPDGDQIAPCKPMFTEKEAAEQLAMLQRFNKFYVTALGFVQLSMAEQCTLGPKDRAKYRDLVREAHGIWDWVERLGPIYDWVIFYADIEDARKHKTERLRKFGSGEEEAHV